MTRQRTRKKKEDKGYDYGLKVLGAIRVFCKDKTIKSNNNSFEITEHWFTVSKKDENDNWINKSMRMFFSKDDDKPEHNSVIFVEDGNFLLSGNNGYERIALFVREWDYVEE